MTFLFWNVLGTPRSLCTCLTQCPSIWNRLLWVVLSFLVAFLEHWDTCWRLRSQRHPNLPYQRYRSTATAGRLRVWYTWQWGIGIVGFISFKIVHHLFPELRQVFRLVRGEPRGFPIIRYRQSSHSRYRWNQRNGWFRQGGVTCKIPNIAMVSRSVS